MPVSVDGGRRGASSSMTLFVAAEVGRRPRMTSPGTVASTKCRSWQGDRQKEQKPDEVDELFAHSAPRVNHARRATAERIDVREAVCNLPVLVSGEFHVLIRAYEPEYEPHRNGKLPPRGIAHDFRRRK